MDRNPIFKTCVTEPNNKKNHDSYYNSEIDACYRETKTYHETHDKNPNGQNGGKRDYENSDLFTQFDHKKIDNLFFDPMVKNRRGGDGLRFDELLEDNLDKKSDNTSRSNNSPVTSSPLSPNKYFNQRNGTIKINKPLEIHGIHTHKKPRQKSIEKLASQRDELGHGHHRTRSKTLNDLLADKLKTDFLELELPEKQKIYDTATSIVYHQNHNTTYTDNNSFHSNHDNTNIFSKNPPPARKTKCTKKEGTFKNFSIHLRSIIKDKICDNFTTVPYSSYRQLSQRSYSQNNTGYAGSGTGQLNNSGVCFETSYLSSNYSKDAHLTRVKKTMNKTANNFYSIIGGTQVEDHSSLLMNSSKDNRVTKTTRKGSSGSNPKNMKQMKDKGLFFEIKKKSYNILMKDKCKIIPYNVVKDFDKKKKSAFDNSTNINRDASSYNQNNSCSQSPTYDFFRKKQKCVFEKRGQIENKSLLLNQTDFCYKQDLKGNLHEKKKKNNKSMVAKKSHRKNNNELNLILNSANYEVYLENQRL